MLSAGNLLFIAPYIFKNGNAPAPKFFIVLATKGNGIVVASLPTSKDHIPSHLTKKHGCIDSAKDSFNCYFFSGNQAVCDNGFTFTKETFVYGQEIGLVELDLFSIQYPKFKGVTLKGKLRQEEYDALIACLKNSPATTKKIQRLL